MIRSLILVGILMAMAMLVIGWNNVRLNKHGEPCKVKKSDDVYALIACLLALVIEFVCLLLGDKSQDILEVCVKTFFTCLLPSFLVLSLSAFAGEIAHAIFLRIKNPAR